MTGVATLALGAMILDAALGEPEVIWRRWPHPAVLMGRAVAWAEARFNHGGQRRLRGTGAMAGLALGAGALGAALHHLPDGGVVEIVVAAILLAQRSLVDHVRAVAVALRQDLGAGRQAVAMIVGRDTGALTGPGVARAAVESAAENLSDGVIAPLFWYLIAGLPGLMIYKITNTADSMIGHRTPRYEQFGWAAARFDDLLNLLPARLTALLIALVQGVVDPRPIWRDARLHRSPNAGWPEAAMAVGLNIALSGPRSYHGDMRPYPWVWPEGRRDAGPDDIDAAARVLWQAWAVMLAVVAVLAVMGG